MNEIMTPIQRLTRDLANAAYTLSDAEARFLVDSYYVMQDARIRADGQIRSINKSPVEVTNAAGEIEMVAEPHEILSWFSQQNADMENQIKRALSRYVEKHPMGQWMDSIFGIGPVIAAGLLAHIDIHQAPTVGHIWRFAGLDPTSRWEKKTKRPWNAKLKVLCWKAGESFVMFHKDERCQYGHFYASQKTVYAARNGARDYATRAATILTEKNYNQDTDAYKAYSVGKFPPAHIHAMARRYAVKLFLSHLHGEMYRRMLGKGPPLPYPIAHMGHVHII